MNENVQEKQLSSVKASSWQREERVSNDIRVANGIPIVLTSSESFCGDFLRPFSSYHSCQLLAKYWLTA